MVVLDFGEIGIGTFRL